MILNVKRIVSILPIYETVLFEGQSTTEAINGFFRRALEKNHGNIKNIFFSLLLLNLIKKGILHFLNAKLVYLQGALLKKQLIASFLEHFKGKS